LAERAAHALTRLERDQAKVKLQALIKRYFGRSSEKLDPNQIAFAWAAVQADHADGGGARRAAGQGQARAPSVKRAQRMEDLPVMETVTIDCRRQRRWAPDGRPLVKIARRSRGSRFTGPASSSAAGSSGRVYASAGHACAPRVAALPARVIPGGQVGAGLIAHVLMSKYADAIPLYGSAMLERLGPAFTRQAMGQWVEHGAGLLRPVYQELQRIVREAGYVQGDETPHRVLDPARPGAAREAWLWTFLCPEPGVVVFDFQLTRSHEPALAFLRNYRGVFQTDVTPVTTRPCACCRARSAPDRAHHCMAHCRRGFVAALEAGDERAAPFLAYLGASTRSRPNFEKCSRAASEGPRLQISRMAPADGDRHEKCGRRPHYPASEHPRQSLALCARALAGADSIRRARPRPLAHRFQRRRKLHQAKRRREEKLPLHRPS